MKKLYSYKCPHCGFVAMFEEERSYNEVSHFCPFCSDQWGHPLMKKILHGDDLNVQ